MGGTVPHTLEVLVEDLQAMTAEELIAFAEEELGFYLSVNQSKEANLSRLLTHGLSTNSST